MHEHWKINGWKVSQLTEHRVTRSILVNFSLSTTSLIQSFAKLCFIFFFFLLSLFKATSGAYTTLLQGVCVSFFFPFLPLFFFRTQIFSKRSILFRPFSLLLRSILTKPFLSCILRATECRWPSS